MNVSAVAKEIMGRLIKLKNRLIRITYEARTVGKRAIGILLEYFVCKWYDSRLNLQLKTLLTFVSDVKRNG